LVPLERAREMDNLAKRDRQIASSLIEPLAGRDGRVFFVFQRNETKQSSPVTGIPRAQAYLCSIGVVFKIPSQVWLMKRLGFERFVALSRQFVERR